MFKDYDVIVVGGGHAGCEAAHISARMGASVLLITMNMQTIGQMSCNPAMGGVAKGQIIREIDALGGMSGIVTDHSMIQFRMLNKSKGPAMWSPRSQNDRMIFAQKWRNMIEQNENIDLWQEMMVGLELKGDDCVGIKTKLGLTINSKTVILTNGTFLNGLIHIGEKNFSGGKTAERSSVHISTQLKDLGFITGRMKTGTPPRVDGRSLDYSKMEVQPGDEEVEKFSFTDTPKLINQIPCHITYTDTKVHDCLRTGFDRSPMFNGRIRGLGPRYCPSIEDKIDRFADKDRHQIFVKPEGRNTCEIYVNGFSTSLPIDVQYKAIKLLPGFEHAKLFKPGYAIEYDFFQPTQLKNTLETKKVKNLYFAGQINGTTGYEEAACQGLMAGINAVQSIRNNDPFVLSRSRAYIGVLIDDLINKGTNEPYRMFTSRAEFRLLLRHDNADLRLTDLTKNLNFRGMENRIERVENKKEEIKSLSRYFQKTSVSPEEINPMLIGINSSPINQKVKLKSILSRPFVTVSLMSKYVSSLNEELQNYKQDSIQSVEVNLKYDGYIKKEEEMAHKMTRLESVFLKEDFDYHSIQALSSEAREKLSKIKPSSIGQASRISGVSPADISILLVHLGR